MTHMIVAYKLQRPLHEEQLRALGDFANTYGLQKFHLDEEKLHLTFEYDGSRLRETVVEHVLRAARIPVVQKLPPA